MSAFYEEFIHGHLQRTIQENWLLLINKLTGLINKFIPVITVKTRSTVPWFTQQLRRLNNKKKRLYKQAVQKDTFNSWTKYKKCDKEYQSLLKSTRRHFFNHDLSSILANNPRRFWRVVNPKCYPDIVLSNNDGVSVPTSQCADVLNQAFSSVFTREDVSSAPILHSFSSTVMPEIVISEAGVLSLLQKLKISSTLDNIGLNNKILKSISFSITPFLCALFSQSLSTGTLPQDWLSAKVVPLFKSGERSSPLNYRPISLTSTICKLMEHIIHTQVINYLERHNIIFNFQHGFRKGFSCDTQLAGFVHDLHKSMDAGCQVDAIFLDFAKAFDRVPHHRLLLKLEQLNIHPIVLAWIKAFLSSRSQFTFAMNFYSSSLPVTSGVPQGSVLGPLLFLVYINDLPNSLSSHVRLFADDCVIYRNISSDSDRLALQSDLNKINHWCSTWLMSLNVSKTKCMSFTNAATRFPSQYSLNNMTLELTSTYKYLGLHFQSNLSWHHHIEVTLAAANRSLGLLKRNLKQAPSQLKKLAFTSLIRPKIEYASAIWDPHQAYIVSNIESLQNRAARFIYSDYSTYSSVTNLKNRAELEDLAIRRKYARLSLFHKLYNHPSLHDSFFEPACSIFPRRDHPNKVKRPLSRTLRFAQSFIPRTIIEWNSLPAHIATEKDSVKFSELMRTTVTN